MNVIFISNRLLLYDRFMCSSVLRVLSL